MRIKRFLHKAVSVLAVAAAVLIGITAAPGAVDHGVVAGGTSVPKDPGWG
ncbi:hypothetical protein [Streptomyces sp. NPDC058674]